MEKYHYHASSVIQDLYFRVGKRVVSGVFHCRYIINGVISLPESMSCNKCVHYMCRYMCCLRCSQKFQ